MKNTVDYLSKGEVDFFKDNGYLLVKNVFSKEKILQLKETCKKAAESDLKKNVKHNPNSLHCITELSAYNGLRDLLYNPDILKILKQLLGGDPIYFGDSAFCYRQPPGRRSAHTDTPNDPTGFFSKKDYPLIRWGLYLQDHSKYRGGLKVQSRSHKNISLYQYLYHYHFWRIRYIKRKLLKKEPLLKNKGLSLKFVGAVIDNGYANFMGSIPFLPSKCSFINIRNEIGDLVLWDERTRHSAEFVTLKSFPNISFPPPIENYIPKVFVEERPESRSLISATYGVASKELDSYMNHIGRRADYLEHWIISKFGDPKIKKLLNENGLEVRYDCLKLAAEKSNNPTIKKIYLDSINKN